MMRSLSLLLIFWTLPVFANCAGEVEGKGSTHDRTTEFIGYLGDILESGGTLEIAKLIEGIKNRNQIINPAPHKTTRHGILFAGSSDEIHYEGLQLHINDPGLDTGKIFDWAVGIQEGHDRSARKRKMVQEETETIHQQMNFYPVRGGEFMMPDYRRQGVRDSTAPKVHRQVNSFLAMPTQVTQFMWVKIMGGNPSHIKSGPRETSMLIGKERVVMLPDNPVENMTWWSAAVFANRVSEKMGLPPVYNLDKVELNPKTSAAAGTLAPIENSVADISINAPDGNIHLAKGVRLPTEAELYYMLTDRGRSTTKYFSNVDDNNITDFEYLVANSNRRHPVGELAPYMIDGYEFFDLWGNVEEWTTDDDELGQPSPLGGVRYRSRIVVGHSYRNVNQRPWRITLTCLQHEDLGLRLVRSILP